MFIHEYMYECGCEFCQRSNANIRDLNQKESIRIIIENEVSRQEYWDKRFCTEKQSTGISVRGCFHAGDRAITCHPAPCMCGILPRALRAAQYRDIMPRRGRRIKTKMRRRIGLILQRLWGPWRHIFSGTSHNPWPGGNWGIFWSFVCLMFQEQQICAVPCILFGIGCTSTMMTPLTPTCKAWALRKSFGRRILAMPMSEWMAWLWRSW